MKRRFLAWLLCLVMLFNNALPVFATEGEGEQIIIENTDTSTETTSESTAETEATTTASSAATEPTSETTEPETEAKKEEITPPESENTSASEETSSETSSTAASSENTSETTTEAAEACTECGSTDGHLDTCSQYVPEIPVCGICGTYNQETDSCNCVICEECGANSTNNEPHSDDCSNKPCEHCEQVGDHAEGCPALCICGDEHNASDYNCPLFGGPRYCECDYDIETLEHESGCHVPVAALHKKLMKAETAEEMYEKLIEAENTAIDLLIALTFDEINELQGRISELYPEEYEAYTTGEYESSAVTEVLDYLTFLPNSTCPDCGLSGIHTEDCPRKLGVVFANDFQTAFNNAKKSSTAGTDSVTMEGTYVLNGKAEIDRLVLVPAGKTLTITGSGTILRTGHSKTSGLDMFQLVKESKLIIGEKNVNSTAKDTIILDGENTPVHRPLILAYAGGDVELYHVTLRNNRNRASVSDNFRGSAFHGGAIHIYPACTKDEKGKITSIDYTPSLTLYSCSINNCSSYVYGGGIYSVGCNITLENSEILNCTVAGAVKSVDENNRVTAYYGGHLQANGLYHADRGSGGGIKLDGFNAYGLSPVCTIKNSNISYNTAVGYGGGIEINNGASVTMESGSLNYNTSLNRGAGALHVTADAKFTMEDGEMVGNVCYEVGGAIHTSYTCELNLKGGVIKDNIAYGRGGGVHVDVGGDLVLNGTDIINNHAKDSVTLNGELHKNIGVSNIVGGVYVNALGEIKSDPIWWGKAQFRGNAGYGGGVLIDCGTCTLNAGTISGNTADVGGGGLCFVMLLISSDNRFGQTGVCGFEMNGGTISDNHANKFGGAVYLMKNALDLESVVIANGYDSYRTDENNGIIFIKDGKDVILKDADNNNLSPQDIRVLFDAIPTVEINSGKLSGNSAGVDGGAIYQEENTEFYMNGGTITSNNATNGGGVYVAEGYAEINGGTITSNVASNDGGAIYITGDVKMTDGEITSNEAMNGGAMYVSAKESGEDNTVYIEHGIINNNKATGTPTDLTDRTQKIGNGGAIYLNGNANTSLKMESGQMNDNVASNDGGAIFATAGTLEIGLNGCKGTEEELTRHTDLGTGRYHPEIKSNKAEDCGGGIAVSDEGVVHFYCGVAINNEASYKGVGKNVFMDGGTFNFYDGTNVGVPRDPDLVIIGGTLNDMCQITDYVDLWYYENNTDTGLIPFKGLAQRNEFMNLPEGEYFWEADEGYTFVGWTPFGIMNESEEHQIQIEVRDKDDYKPSGTSVQIDDKKIVHEGVDQNTFDGNSEDDTMHLYAVWAPIENDINYVDSLTNGVSATSKYEIDKANSQTITISASNATQHPGFDVVGWYLYQNEGQNANWCEIIGNEYKAYEPEYQDGKPHIYGNLDYAKTDSAVKIDGHMKYYALDERNGDLTLTIDPMTFGDITLVADYALAHGDLTIEKDGWKEIDPYQTFIFDVNSTEFTAVKEVSGIAVNSTLDVCSELNNLEAVDLEVMVAENGSVTITYLPLGKYTVTEDENWSWRYSVVGDKIKPVEVNKTGGAITVANTRPDVFWMDGNAWCRNIFDERKSTQKPVPKEYKS